MKFHMYSRMKHNNKSIKIKEEILKLIRNNKVLTTIEVASILHISWNTAEKYLLELTLDNKIERIKKTGTNLWLRK